MNSIPSNLDTTFFSLGKNDNLAEQKIDKMAHINAYKLIVMLAVFV